MTRQYITLLTRRGPERAQAWVCGPLALHRSHHKANLGWSVTHRPSGLKIVSLIHTQRLAREVLNRLLCWEGVNWHVKERPVPDALRPALLAYLRGIPRRYQHTVRKGGEEVMKATKMSDSDHNQQTEEGKKPMVTKTKKRTLRRLEGSSGNGACTFVKWDQEGSCDEGVFIEQAPTGKNGIPAYSFKRDDGTMWKCWVSWDLQDKFQRHNINPGTYVRIEYLGLGSDKKTKMFVVDADI